MLPFPDKRYIMTPTIASEVFPMNRSALTTASFFFYSYARFMGMGFFAEKK